MTSALTGIPMNLPPANDDEARVPPYAPEPLALDGSAGTLAKRQRAWRSTFAAKVYGPVPPPPDAIDVLRERFEAEGYDRLAITMRVGPRSHRVDAALWLPPRKDGPVPLVCGLAFLGPAGVLLGETYPLDRNAVVAASDDAGLADGVLDEQVRGIHAARWPLPLILGAGHGLLLTCYGSWVPDHPDRWQNHGLWPLLAPADDATRPGALSLWAWALQRMVDVASGLAEVDASRISVAGHSRLGKAALWAAATDERIAAALVNNAGCLGPALSCRAFGETPRHLAAAFPHWVRPGLAANGAASPDQHALIACVAPRRVYVASASADWWADPRGEYEGLAAALPAWSGTAPLPRWADAAAPGTSIDRGAVGWHLRQGSHGLTPWDWRRFLRFLARDPTPT